MLNLFIDGLLAVVDFPRLRLGLFVTVTDVQENETEDRLAQSVRKAYNDSHHRD